MEELKKMLIQVMMNYQIISFDVDPFKKWKERKKSEGIVEGNEVRVTDPVTDQQTDPVTDRHM